MKKHKWFDKLNFSLIRNLTPPIIPKISSPTDTSNFRSIKDEEEKHTNGESRARSDSHEQFESFKPSELQVFY